jgi:hypothetical protein
MPSEERVRMAHEALQAHAESFRGALSEALERVRTQLVAQSATASVRSQRLAMELGPFAAGRIDPARFTAFALEDRPADPTSLRALDLVAAALRELLARGDRLLRVDVPADAVAAERLEEALAEVGRAFGAARVAELARVGAYRATEHRRLLVGFPFDEWSPGERRMAPPLLVELDGRDLDAPALARFLDGRVRLVLAVRGEAPPAPLSRLLGAGVLVAQAASPERAGAALAALAAAELPGVVALMPDGAAEFLFDPARPAAERLAVWSAPERAPKQRIGPWSGPQMAAELAALWEQAELRSRAAVAGAPAGNGHAAAEAAADPADMLAAWLLAQVEA